MAAINEIFWPEQARTNGLYLQTHFVMSGGMAITSKPSGEAEVTQ